MLPTQVVMPRLTGFPVGAEIKKAYWPLRLATDAVPVIRMEDDALFVVSVTDVAVRVTLPPEGTAGGAVYIVVAVLPGEVLGLNEPHDPAGVQLQFTPAPAESFATVAVTDAVPETDSVAGGAVEIVTEMAGGAGALIVTVA